MSATEQMRDMISQLMGSDPTEENPDKVEYWETEVCRAYLLACCPHEVLAGTRMDIGSCARIHEPALRADFNRAEENGKDHYYDLDALEMLERFFGECERKKELAKKRLEESQEELGEDAATRALAESVLELNEQIGQKLADIEHLGEEGKVEESLKANEALEELKRKKAEADAEYRASMPASSYQQQKLRVCEVCSAYLGIHDNDRRLADHFGGKLHIGFVFLREKLAELRAAAEGRRQDRDGRSTSRKRNLSRDRERPAKRSRSRERGERGERGERDRRRDRDRDRDRRDRDRDRKRRRRSRSGDRDREDRHRRRRHSTPPADEDEDLLETRGGDDEEDTAPPPPPPSSPPPPPPQAAPPPPPAPPRPPSEDGELGNGAQSE